MKKVYIVSGSEDGAIGVFTTISKAFYAAHGYLGETEFKHIDKLNLTETGSFKDVTKIKATLSNLQSEFAKGYTSVTMGRSEDSTEAHIAKFELNKAIF